MCRCSMIRGNTLQFRYIPRGEKRLSCVRKLGRSKQSAISYTYNNVLYYKDIAVVLLNLFVLAVALVIAVVLLNLFVLAVALVIAVAVALVMIVVLLNLFVLAVAAVLLNLKDLLGFPFFFSII